MIREEYRVTSEKIEALSKMSRENRLKILKDRLLLSMVYYLPQFIEYQFSDFHYDMEKDHFDLRDGNIKWLMWIAFREASKTSVAKGAILHDILFQHEHYINVDSFDGDNSERILFDIVHELQTNPRILEDFGNIYNEELSKERKSQKKINDFVTSEVLNSRGIPTRKAIRCSAYNTQQPVRGRLHGNIRPTKLILDDFETKKTIESEAHTNAIKNHIKEFKTGMDQRKGKILFLANYISDNANVQSIIDKMDKSDNMRYRIIPIIERKSDEKGGFYYVPSWPQKYVMDKSYLEDVDNRIPLDQLKKDLWTPDDGDLDWETELMCNPFVNSSSYFKKEYFIPIDWEELKDQITGVYVTVDTPSTKDGEISYYNDYFAVCINYITKNNWNFEIIRKRSSPSEMINTIVNIDTYFRSLSMSYKFAWEDTAFTRGLNVGLKQELQRLGMHLPVYLLKHQGRNKDDRIRSGLLNRYEKGAIRHVIKDGKNTCHPLENELLKFGRGPKFDDCMDAASYQDKYAPNPNYILNSSSEKMDPALIINSHHINSMKHITVNDLFDLVSGKYGKGKIN